MNDKRSLSFSEQALKEIWDQISQLEGPDLDDFLAAVGLNPNELLQNYAKAVEAAAIVKRRSRFEEAKKFVCDSRRPGDSNVVSLDISRKKEILAAIRERTSKGDEMTIAARNQKIEAEGDLDSFLEACVRLGLIDENGNLKV